MAGGRDCDRGGHAGNYRERLRRTEFAHRSLIAQRCGVKGRADVSVSALRYMACEAHRAAGQTKANRPRGVDHRGISSM